MQSTPRPNWFVLHALNIYQKIMHSCSQNPDFINGNFYFDFMIFLLISWSKMLYPFLSRNLMIRLISCKREISWAFEQKITQADKMVLQEHWSEADNATLYLKYMYMCNNTIASSHWVMKPYSNSVITDLIH